MLRYLLPTITVLVLTTMTGHIATVGAADGASTPDGTSTPDGASTQVRSFRATPSAASLVAAVCPVEEALDRQRAICEICPDSAPRDRGRLSARRVYRGDFTGDGPLRAVLALNGCAPSHGQGHATAFLTRTDDGWRQTDYRQGMNTSSCRIVDDPRGWTTLVCRDRRLAEGKSETDVFALSATEEGWERTDLGRLFDHSAQCEADGEIIRRLKSIHTGELVEDAPGAIGLLVETRRREQNAGCNPDQIDRSLRLKVFRRTADGLDPVEIDEPCGHPGRAKALEGASPGHCSQ